MEKGGTDYYGVVDVIVEELDACKITLFLQEERCH